MISTKIKISSGLFSIAIIITYFMQKLDGYYAIEYMRQKPIFALTLILPGLYIIYMILTCRGNEKSITLGVVITVVDAVFGFAMFSVTWMGMGVTWAIVHINVATLLIPVLGVLEFIARRGLEEAEEMKK